MKRFFLLLFFLTCTAFAQPSNVITREQIMVTNNGFFINWEGNLASVSTLTYIGDNLYTVSQPYYGACKRCGWPVNQEGKCSNPACHGYGPKKD